MASTDVQVTGATGKTYTFNFGMNSACALEEAIGDERTYPEIMRELQGPRPRVNTVRQFVKASLVDPVHATLEQTGAIIDDLGGYLVILAALNADSAEARLAIDALKLMADAPAEQPADGAAAPVGA
jgi:hypothetical protein